MPLYKYRAADANDRIVKGQIEALHETDLETQLRRVGLSLVRATITKARTRKVKSLPQQEIIGFMFQLEMLIRAGAEEKVIAHLRQLNQARQRAALRDRLLQLVLGAVFANTANLGAGLTLLVAASAMAWAFRPSASAGSIGAPVSSSWTKWSRARAYVGCMRSNHPAYIWASMESRRAPC